MFSQPPDDDHNNQKKNQNHPRRWRKNIFPHKNKHKGKKNQLKKKNSRVANNFTMSSWAENFTNAATWQLKHQIAYWKSKAMALEYENRILHDVIRKNYLKESCTVPLGQPNNYTNHEETDTTEAHCEEYEDDNHQDDEENDGDLVVSEEFIQFLKDNAKFKEDARRERERLKAEYNTEEKIIEDMEAGPSRNKEDKQKNSKDLYGEHWEKIIALETSLQSKFIHECDTEKPQYWPNIPFNFNFS